MAAKKRTDRVTQDKRDDPKPKRPPRVPMQAGQKLYAEPIEGYQQYWAIDKPGLIERMEAAYWEFVTDERGQKITVPAGSGFTHYLMKIEQKYYDEDMKRQQDLITESTKQAAELQKGEYVPEGHDGVLTREVIV